MKEEYRMEKKNSEIFRRVIALLLCAAMVMPFVPLTAQGAQPAENVTVITEADTLEADQTLNNSPVLWGVDTQNYFVDGKVIALHGFWAQDIANGTGFNDGVCASWQNFINNELYKKYTAFIMEYVGNNAPTEYQFFVDAIIDGALPTDEAIYQIKAHTDTGFVLLIPTAQLTEANAPTRGDVVSINWYMTDPNAQYDLGTTGPNGGSMGTVSVKDNPAAGVATVDKSQIAGLNANVNLYNYDQNMNTYGNGFNFWAGFWGYGGDIETVDGTGNEDEGATHRFPVASSELDDKGYPQLVVNAETGETLSLGYLFDGSSTRLDGNSTLISTMTNGGGLFQKDADGYYYYDSLLNAAYYDASLGRFVLCDNLAVRPWYGSGQGADSYFDKTANAWLPVPPGGFVESYGNFLPFNKVTADNITLDVTYAKFAEDGSYNYVIDDTAGVCQTIYPVGSLEYMGLKSYAANKLLTGTKGMSEKAYNEIAEHALDSVGHTITTARLEDVMDMWFGMTVDFEFYMPEGGLVDGKEMTFDFHGDDDVYVYLGIWDETKGEYDYKLVLDIGGVHEARSGLINFATGAVTDYPPKKEGAAPASTTLKEIFGLEGDTFADYTKLSLKFFYMERGGNISYCRLRFNIPTLPDKSLSPRSSPTHPAPPLSPPAPISSGWFTRRIPRCPISSTAPAIPFWKRVWRSATAPSSLMASSL